VDTNAILSKLNRIATSAAPGAILEKGSLAGPDPLALLWVDAKRLRRFLEGVRVDAEIAADWVENITVAQVEDALMTTYFFRSTSGSAQTADDNSCFAVRSTSVPASPDAWTSLPTIRDLWPMAAPMENYVSELFGIRFVGPDGADLVIPSHLISEAQTKKMQGFPLRKNFVLELGQ
jgi:hypothetical protein